MLKQRNLAEVRVRMSDSDGQILLARSAPAA